MTLEKLDGLGVARGRGEALIYTGGMHSSLKTKSMMAMITTLTLSCGSFSKSSMNDRASAINALFRDYTGNVPGASVLVVENDQVVFQGSYGLADLETKEAVTAATNFRLASVSKQFTAAAIGILVKRAHLSYEDRIKKHLPNLPAYADPITIRQLLTHSSGLPDYEDLVAEDATEQLNDTDVLHSIERTTRPLFPAGSQYRYSNTGYVFLGLIAEKVSGASFAQLLKQEIFEPLEMTRTVAYERSFSTIEHRAYGHTKQGKDWVRRDQSITSATLGDGGIYSSIDDLARWNDELDHGRIIDTDTLRLAFTPAVATDDPNVRYGFGWRISQYRGPRTLWHSGETAGFRNVIIRFPDNHLTVIILTNRDDPEPYSTALQIADLYLR